MIKVMHLPKVLKNTNPPTPASSLHPEQPKAQHVRRHGPKTKNQASAASYDAYVLAYS